MSNSPETVISKLDANNREQLEEIAAWYYQEWETPVEKTVERLSKIPNEVELLQLVLSIEGKCVATTGLSYDVNLLNVYPEFKKWGPWVALFYTVPEYRNKGLGKILLDALDEHAIKLGLDKIYLCTFTAESLYSREGWRVIENVSYKGRDSVVMEKTLEQL